MPIRSATGYLPVSDPMTCEVCGKVVALADTHSIAMGYRMPGNGFTAFQCIDEQHFACSEEHALLAAVQCYFNHIRDLGDFAGKGTESYGTPYNTIREQALSF